MSEAVVVARAALVPVAWLIGFVGATQSLNPAYLFGTAPPLLTTRSTSEPSSTCAPLAGSRAHATASSPVR